MGAYGTGSYGVGLYGGATAPPDAPPMRALLPRVTSPGGASWAYLDIYGRTGGLSYTWTYPGGPSACEFSLDVPPDARIPALQQGSTLTIGRGTSTVWAGRVTTIDRGSPWRIQADGLAGLATREPATTGSLDAIVDNAITNGMPWTRPASLSSRGWYGGAGGQDVADTKLDEVLGQVLVADGKRWTLDAGGRVSAVTDPTVVALVIRADAMPPVSLSAYASEVTARYMLSSTGYSTVRVVNTVAAQRFGRVAQNIDLSGLGTLTSEKATAYAQAYLDRVAPRMTVAGDFAVRPGQVRTATGGAVDLTLMRPGVIARVQVISLIRDTMLVPQASIDVLIGATTYKADEDTLTISPAARALSPLQVMFGGSAKVVES